MEDTATPVEDAPRRNKPRLAIKKMVLENFKSYAGAQHVGPFHKVGWNANGDCSVCVFSCIALSSMRATGLRRSRGFIIVVVVVVVGFVFSSEREEKLTASCV